MTLWGTLSALNPPPATEYSRLMDYVAKLSSRLELERRDDFDEARIRRDIENADERGLPAGLSNEAVTAAANGFRVSVGTLIAPTVNRALAVC